MFDELWNIQFVHNQPFLCFVVTSILERKANASIIFHFMLANNIIFCYFASIIIKGGVSMEEIKGKAIGGKARADKLTAERRQDIAREAAKKRWDHSKPVLPKATHVGDLKIGDSIIKCAVLEDGRRILTRATFLRAMGRTGKAKGGRGYDDEFKTPVFLTAKNLKPFISEELIENSTPIIFNLNGREAIGYKADLLPQVCTVFIDAEESGSLNPNQLHIAQRCKILLKSFATVGLIALIDEATKYQGVRPQDALQAYLEIIIRKELAAWAKKFPDEFYENIYKLKGWQWPGMQKNRFSVVAYYTRDLVYERIAPTLLKKLEEKSPKDDKGQRKNKLHQWLTEDVGDPLLAQHLHSLVMFQRLALSNGYGWNRFVKMVDKVLPRKGANLELPFPEPGLEL
jgi:hypothetical protein